MMRTKQSILSSYSTKPEKQEMQIPTEFTTPIMDMAKFKNMYSFGGTIGEDGLTQEMSDRIGSDVSTGLGLASGAISALDQDPSKTSQLDILGKGAQMAAAGAALGPAGALIGGVAGLAMGAIQKKSESKALAKAKQQEKDAESLQQQLGFEKQKSQEAINASEVQTALLNNARQSASGKTFYQEGGSLNKPPRTPETQRQIDFLNSPEFKRKRDAVYFEERDEQNRLKEMVSYDFLKDLDNPYMDNTNVFIPSIPNKKERLEIFMNRDRTKPTPQGMLEDAGVMSTEKQNFAKTFQTGGMTQGAYSHSTNPLKVVDKSGNDTGMELTGGEGVFDKPAMGRIKAFAKGGNFEALGQFVKNEMNTWKHK